MAITDDVVIIGGGITGLTVAHQLRKRGYGIRLLDAPAPGGLVRSRTTNGFSLELGANTLVLNQSMEELLLDLGLRERVRFPAIERYRQYVKYNGTIVEVPKSPPKFLTSPLFSAGEKMRVLKGLSRKLQPHELQRDESVAAFFARLLGDAPGQKVIAPVLRGIFGGDLNELRIGAVFPKLFTHLAEGGTLFSYGQSQRVLRRKIFCLDGGNESICDSIRRNLGSAVTTASVSTVLRRGDGFSVRTEDGSEWQCSRVVVATAGRASARFLADLDPAEAAHMSELRYAPIVALHFAIPRHTILPRDGFGVLFPRNGDSPLLGIMFNSMIFPHVAPADRHLVTVCLGGVGNEWVLSESDSALADRGASALRTELGVAASTFLSLQRWDLAIPQYDTHHAAIERTYRALESTHPGLHFVGADTGGVGVPNRVERAFELAEAIGASGEIGTAAFSLSQALP